MKDKRSNNRKRFRKPDLGNLILIALFVMLAGAFTLGLTFQSKAFGDYNDYD